MKISPLLLEGYFVSDISVRSNLAFKGNGESSESEIRSFVNRASKNDDPRRWQVTLSLEMDEAEFEPYFFKVTMIGFFAVADVVPSERVEDIIFVNAPAVLAGAIRELLAMITARGPHSPYLLPSVTFLDEKPVRQVAG